MRIIRLMSGVALAAAITAGGTLVSTSASATSITVLNPSFEILPIGGLPSSCGVGCSFDFGPIPDWNITGANTGQFQPGPPSGTTAYFNSVPDGTTIAFTNGGDISQTVGVTAQAGVTYTLQVYEGVRNDSPFVSISDLIVGTHSILATGTPPLSGGWSLFTASYTATAADAGSAITIDLSSSQFEGAWDNVSLDASSIATPLPSTWLMLISGLVSIGFLVCRGTKKNTSALASA